MSAKAAKAGEKAAKKKTQGAAAKPLKAAKPVGGGKGGLP